MKTNDHILAVNGEKVFIDEFRKKVVESKNQQLTIQILRGSDSLNLPITPNENGKIGIGFVTEFKKLGFNVAHKSYTLGEALPLGVSRGYDFLVNQVKAFGKMFKGEIKASESVGGFKSIAKMFAPEWDWRQFWAMTGSLSLILGFMNLLPIPALDGGYVVFLLWEVVTGKRVSDAIVEKAVQGMHGKVKLSNWGVQAKDDDSRLDKVNKPEGGFMVEIRLKRPPHKIAAQKAKAAQSVKQPKLGHNVAQNSA